MDLKFNLSSYFLSLMWVAILGEGLLFRRNLLHFSPEIFTRIQQKNTKETFLKLTYSQNTCLKILDRKFLPSWLRVGKRFGKNPL